MKKLRRRGVSCILACLLLAAAMPQAGLAAEVGQPPLLIILLDVSGSMSREENDHERKAVKWAAGLSANCRELGIEVAAFTFGANVNALALENILETVYTENRTNHLDAMAKAEKLVNANPARKTCIVMLSDGALDLQGRGIGDVPENRPRDDTEKAAINDFLTMCAQLGASGSKLFLVGCGASEGNLEDLYAISGFGMFKKVGEEKNCKFLRASQMDLSELTQHVFSSLGYQSSTSADLQIAGNTITFSLDRPYYKTHVCVSKTSDDLVREDETKVRWNGEMYPAFHVNNEYKSMFIVCLDEPDSGEYEIVLPDLKNNIYTVLNQTSFDILAMKIELRGDQVKYVESEPPTYTLPVGNMECQLEIALDHSGTTREDVEQCWYTVLLERTDGVADRNGDETCTPIVWVEDSSQSQMTVPLVLPEPFPRPVDISEVTYTIEAHLITKDGREVDSNKIKVQPKELYETPSQKFSDKAGKEIDISPSRWTGVAVSDDASYVEYYMLDQALVQGEDLTGKMPLPIPWDSEEYEIAYDADGIVKIKFKQPGEYFMAINLYGKARADAQGHFIIEENPGCQKIILPVAILAGTGVALCGFVALFKRLGRRKR